MARTKSYKKEFEITLRFMTQGLRVQPIIKGDNTRCDLAKALCEVESLNNIMVRAGFKHIKSSDGQVGDKVYVGPKLLQHISHYGFTGTDTECGTIMKFLRSEIASSNLDPFIELICGEKKEKKVKKSK